jgi:hypothetical protein
MYKVAIQTDSQLLVYLFNQKENTLLQAIDISAQSVIWSPDNTALLAITDQLLFVDERREEKNLEREPIIEQLQVRASKAAFGYKSGRYCYLAKDKQVLVLDRKERKVIETIEVLMVD